MSPRHFSKTMQSPYFQSKYYREESVAGKTEAKIEERIEKIFYTLFFWKKNKPGQSN
jgi:hypothetical protein